MKEKIRKRINGHRVEIIMIGLIIIGSVLINNGFNDLWRIGMKLFGYTKFKIYSGDIVATNPLFGCKDADCYSCDLELIKIYATELIRGIIIFAIGYVNVTRKIKFITITKRQ